MSLPRTRSTPCVATRREYLLSSTDSGRANYLYRTLKNPKVSNEAKQHANEVLNNELGWDNPRQELYQIRATNKDPTQVGAGLKA